LDSVTAVGVALQAPCLGGVFTPFFTAQTVDNLSDAKTCDTTAYAAFFRGMLKRGFYLPPSQFEVNFVSSAHTDDDVSRFIDAARESIVDLSVSRSTTLSSPT